jgi:hypothetical protein
LPPFNPVEFSGSVLLEGEDGFPIVLRLDWTAACFFSKIHPPKGEFI